jgi:tRNA pseudouridine55 synthase
MNIVLNLDKPAHITSQQAVAQVKRLLGAKKAGHAGTLDPIATGVLIVCLNEATKITRFLSELDKEYVFQLKLGERTDTFDSTGRIIEKKDPGSIQIEDINSILSRFAGCIQQTPPMYSAVKIGGECLYKLARKGISIDRPERSVQIYHLELISFHPPYVNSKVVCSKGTYIRTLCDEIGNALGTGAHMTALTRTMVGSFKIEDAISMYDLPNRKNTFYSMDESLSHLQEIILDHESWQKAKHGIPIAVSDITRRAIAKECDKNACGTSSELCEEVCEYVRMKTPANILFGIGVLDKNSLRVERLFHIPEG